MSSDSSSTPDASLLTNTRYSVSITAAGTGQSQCGQAVNRWTGDPVEDAHGQFIYLRDMDSGHVWSAALQPVQREGARYHCESEPGMFRIIGDCEGIRTRLDVVVSQKHDFEMRTLRVENLGKHPRRVELTSFFEVALQWQGGDLAHPAFSKLFLQTGFVAEDATLIVERRPRANGETWPCVFHSLIGAHVVQHETDRLRFIGRGNTGANPAAMHGALSGTTGNVLDPCCALRTVIELAPGAARDVTFITGMATSRGEALRIVAALRGRGALVATTVQAGLAQTMRELGAEDQARSFDSAFRHWNLSPPQRLHRPASGPHVAASREALQFFNGFGGFSEDGREYVIRIAREVGSSKRPPQPWINVIANERAGFLVSESGAGCTWARNSQANRITPWSNDPLTDPHGEAIYLRDEARGVVWSPMPGPLPAECDYEVRHGFGSTRFVCEAEGLEQEVTMFVPREEPVKITRLVLRNLSQTERRISVTSYQQLVPGSLPQWPSPIMTHRATDGSLRAVNGAAGELAGGVAFSAMNVGGAEVMEASFTCDRLAFLGRHGSPRNPAALGEGVKLDGASGAGLDPCFAQQRVISIAPGATVTCVVLLGEAMGEAEAASLIAKHDDLANVQRALDEVRAFWSSLVSGVQIETPSRAMDVMVNGWLVYQTLACRMWARTAFYQSSGAYGFRDQLQDSGSLLPLAPGFAREQVLLHARHQFAEGDVLHWWHPAPVERGLRTRFSDDLLWLALVTADYVRATGDFTLLDERVPFLKGPLLHQGEDENYLKPEPSGEEGDIYDHCCRALDRSLVTGVHGLPLMGTGDWNDGMNRVGREGRGESVWMGFFLFHILSAFVPLCLRRGDAERATRYEKHRERLRTALNHGGWDGEWYRRAYFDNGNPLGAKVNDECRIDALAQAWAVIAKAAPPEREASAVAAMVRELVSEEDGIIRLLTPPFVNMEDDPGYIKGYVAGVRENGGQYTHAACWVVKALAEHGDNARAQRLLEMLLPVSHALTPEAVERYKVEPYVVAADVYGAVPHIGRGGWTWYTGSSGWMYRVAIESILGVRIENGDTLVLQPCVPDAWPQFKVTLRNLAGVSSCEIVFENSQRCARQIVSVESDGASRSVNDRIARVPLKKDGSVQRVRVVLG